MRGMWSLAKIVVLALWGVVAIALATGAAVSAANPPRSLLPAASSVAVQLPGAGRVLASPMVVGSDLLGRGSLPLVDGTIGTGSVSMDLAPPEMSLQTFAFVDHGSSGYSAVFRFLHPIVQLHAWRRVEVRHSIAVRLVSPDGAVHAVELQPDGTTAVGAMSGTVFDPSGPSVSAIAGNVAVIDVPASLGVTPDWTVQGVIRVEADQRFVRGVPFTGFLAGTSIVPVGFLTGVSSAALDTAQITDAATALGAAADPTAVPAVPKMRATAVHFEGEGASLVMVVTLNAPPKPDLTNYDSVEIDLLEPGFNTFEQPLIIRWSPAGVPSNEAFVYQAVHVGSSSSGTVPVTFSGNDLRFALGALKFFPPNTTNAPSSTLPMDSYVGQIKVILSRDETVSSADGQSRFTGPQTAAEAATYPAPAKPIDAAVITLNGPAITIQRVSTGAIATGIIDAEGGIVATGATDHYTGLIDAEGDAIIYDASLAANPDGSATTTAPVQVDGDFAASAVATALLTPVLIGETSMKGDLSNPPQLSPFTTPSGSWTERLTHSGSAPDPFAEAARAQFADWPLTAASATTPPGLVGPTGAFFVRVFTTASTTTEPPLQVGSPWIVSTEIPALPTPLPTANATAAAAGSVPAETVVSSQSTVPGSAAVPTPPAAATTDIHRSSASGSSATPFIILVAALLAATTGILLARRRRRNPRGVPRDATTLLHDVVGEAQHTASADDGGHELSLQSDPGSAAYAAAESPPAPEAIGAR